MAEKLDPENDDARAPDHDLERAQSLFLTRRLSGELELDEIEVFGDQGEILAGLKIAAGRARRGSARRVEIQTQKPTSA